MIPKIITEGEGERLMGNRQIIKLRAEDTGSSMSVIFSNVPAGSGIPVHVHSLEDEVFEITDGELELTLNNEVTLLKKGDMAFLPKDVSHGFKAITDVSMWVTLVPGGGEKMFVEMAELPPGPPDRNKIVLIAAKYRIQFI